MASIIGERHKYWCVANTLWIHILVFSNHACWCNYGWWNTLTYLKAKNIFSWSGLNQRRCSPSSKLKKPQVRNVDYKNGFQATWNFPWIVSTLRLLWDAKYNNLRFYFGFHTRIFGEVKLGSSWLRAKITMTSPLRTEKKNRIFHADINSSLFKYKNAQRFMH